MSPDNKSQRKVLGKIAEGHEKEYQDIIESHDDKSVRSLAHGSLFMSREIGAISETLDALPTTDQMETIVKNGGKRFKVWKLFTVEGYDWMDVMKILACIAVFIGFVAFIWLFVHLVAHPDTGHFFK